jgi:hypothetical protein
VTIPQAEEKIHRAYREIFGQINELKLPYTMVVYESLVLNSPQAQFALAKQLRIDPSFVATEVTDQDLKWRREIA